MKLLSYPNPSLKVYCQEVKDFNNEELHKNLDAMKIIMDQNNGFGLAANQVGLDSRIFIMKDLKGNHWEFINPTIIYEDDIQYQDEGCLSFESIAVQVRRPRVVSVKAFKRDGEPFHVIAQDKEAICIMHEIDHLNGQTLMDRLSRQQKRDLLKRMKK